MSDHTGRAVTAETCAGQWQLAVFAFSHCPDICRTTLADMAPVMDLPGPEAAHG